jgi:hypothetical protein
VNLATLSLPEARYANLLDGAGDQSEPTISPNGAWMALAETAGGSDSEINIRAFPAVGRTRIPVAKGAQPIFSRDGSELFFYDGRGLAASPVEYEPTLRVGAPRRLFESSAYFWGQFGRAWDVDASGQRFLMIRNPAVPASAPESSSVAVDAERPRIDVVLNWFEELRTRVPVVQP